MRLFLLVVVIILYIGYTSPRRPEHLKINGAGWKVVWPDKIEAITPLGAEEFAGYTYCDKKLILVSKDEDEDWRQVLMHEVAHALTCGDDGAPHNDAYNSPLEGAHPGIDFLASHWLDFIQQNPEAVRWLSAR